MPTNPETETASPDEPRGGHLTPWTKGELPLPPIGGLRGWMSMVGPGILLAGASIGTGEWLFGPAVSAQYGGMLLWLAGISIISQVFVNHEMIRYTLYTGEPIGVGYFRTRPGPAFWTVVYAILDFSMIWPYNAQNAAVPLAAAFLGHLPGEGLVTLLGASYSEAQVVKFLGFSLFMLAFIPLIFGGAIYKMLERIMTFKLIVVLVYLTAIVSFTVSRKHAGEVVQGFVEFGNVPIRADTIVAGRFFSIAETREGATRVLKGTVENGEIVVVDFVVTPKPASTPDPASSPARERLLERARSLVRDGRFHVEKRLGDDLLIVEGAAFDGGVWREDAITITSSAGEKKFSKVDELPEPFQALARDYVSREGVERAGLVGYWKQNGKLPGLDWAMVAAFAAIAGAGGLTNTSFSNFARDKGWGMGRRVGAIPSAVGGHNITLSHVGCVFALNDESLERWKGWLRHVKKDQMIWMVCSFLGLALPCMLSIEFIRNAPVSGNRVAAMTAEGLAYRYPSVSGLLWSGTLICGFLLLAPLQIGSADQVARRWTDILWTASRRAHGLALNQVKYIYYAILCVYGAWGLFALYHFDPLQTAKIAAVLMNVSLAFTSFHTLYVNRSLLPKELRPRLIMEIGVFCCGAFFLAVSALVLRGS